MLERTARLTGGDTELVLRIEETIRPAPLKGHPHSWDY